MDDLLQNLFGDNASGVRGLDGDGFEGVVQSQLSEQPVVVELDPDDLRKCSRRLG